LTLGKIIHFAFTASVFYAKIFKNVRSNGNL